jgi:hypothetical protein
MTGASSSGTLTALSPENGEPAIPYRNHSRPARDRIVEREVLKLERRAAADRPPARSQRELVVASLLRRPDDGRRAAGGRLDGG